MDFEVSTAIRNLVPGPCSFGLSCDTEEIVQWSSDFKQPTQAEINKEVLRLKLVYDSKQYARNRAKAYPTIAEQADMAYWDRKNNTTTLDDAIDSVKLKYPKNT
jgi:hypothetical protein